MSRTTPGNYVPLDVNYPSDPAIRAAGEPAELLFVRALAYCKRTRTDGFVPDYDLPVVGVGLRGVPKRVQALVTHGLWRPVEGGWVVRSWVKWNKPRQVEEAFVAAQAEHGNRGNHERWHVREGRIDLDCPWCSEANREPDRVPDPPPDSPTRSAPRVANKGREGKGTTSGSSLRSDPARDDDEAQPNGGKIINAWIVRRGERPPSRVVGQTAREVRKLLDDGFSVERIDAALDRMDAKGLNPSTLASLVSANGLAVLHGGQPAELTPERVNDILGPDTETLPPPPPDIDPETDSARYRAWMQQARADRNTQRQQLARAELERRVPVP